MQPIDPEYLRLKSDQLGLGRGQSLTKIQAFFDSKYPDRIRSISINNGVLRLRTPSAPLASDIRLNQIELLKRFGAIDPSIEKIQIIIAPLED